VRNFLADDAVLAGVDVDDENLAFGGGVQVDDKRKWVELLAGWYHVEPNSVVAQFTDNDLFDGSTDRRGWVLRATRPLTRNVDLRFELFDSDSIENGPPFLTPGPAGEPSSVQNADRQRMRIDVQMNF
jgi:hypothetical protein